MIALLAVVAVTGTPSTSSQPQGVLHNSQADTVKITAETGDKCNVSGGQFEFTAKSLFHVTRFIYTYSTDETLQYDSRQPSTFFKPRHATCNDKVASELIINIIPHKG